MLNLSDRLAKCSLLLGFVSVAIAIVVAYQNPATGYELSIYAGTPVLFWVFSALALVLSIVVVFTVSNIRPFGVFLGGVTLTTIVSLPILRGYYYLGEHDPLSHLGTTRVINAGTMMPTESPYPVVHTLGSILHDATGLALNHTLLVEVVVFVVCFIVFVPLVVRELTGDARTTDIAVFSGLLLLPINHLGSHLYIFPTSQAIMFIPVALLVFFFLYRQRVARHSAIFLLIATMFVLLHPQQAANLVIFFGVIAVLQIGYDISARDQFDRRDQWVLPEVTLFGLAFFLWATSLEIFWDNIEAVYTIPFEERQVGGKAALRTGSLAQIGGNLPEVFTKLFLVQSVYVLLTGLLMLLVLRRSGILPSLTEADTIAPDGGTDMLLPVCIFLGLLALTGLFLLYLVGGISDQYFRHLGMLMVFGTILGAIAMGRIMQFVGRQWSPSAARRSIGLVLVLLTVLSLPVVFASPYFYYYSHHVTEQQLQGYSTTFEHQDESIVFGDIRSDTYRYGHAIQGTDRPAEAYYQEGWTDATHGIPDHFADRSLRSYYNEPRYIPVPEADRIRDPVLWDGFRFSHEDFAYLNTEPGINKVQSNGGYDLYIVDPAGEE